MVLLIFFDIVSKFLATKYLLPIGRRPLFFGVELIYVLNNGAAFNIFAGARYFLIALTSIMLLVLLFLLFFGKFANTFVEVCFLLIISGGLGNLINRITTGIVVDFFNFTFVNFAVFNIADCYVSIGVALYIFYSIYNRFKPEETVGAKQ